MKEQIKLHLKDILRECEGRREMGQIEHNVFEIADHLKINMEENKNA